MKHPFLVGGLIMVGGIISTGVYYYQKITEAGLTVSSWWRSIQKNYEIHKRFLAGTQKNDAPVLDWHLFGLAFDVLPPTEETNRILKGMGLHTINEGTHIHAQVYPAGALTKFAKDMGLKWDV